VLHPSRAALPARRARWRRRHGLVPLQVDVDEFGFAEALILSGRLSPDETAIPELVQRELAAVVADFITVWRRAASQRD
jgi:hypothetical protein